DKDKKIILNTASFYVREQIYESYQGKILKILPFFLRPEPENSTLYNSLTTSLMLATDNFPDCKDLIEMYSTLEEFMKAHTYNNSDPKKGYLPITDQLFSKQKIEGYMVEEVLQDLVKKIANLNLEQIETTKKLQLNKDLSGKSDLGMFKSKHNHSKMESDDKEYSQGYTLG
ncbi:MAG: hypothetical protein HYX60_11395, partial [Legionella longbeachae]|nr:hypothetical protein [Legionella longbeachae]